MQMCTQTAATGISQRLNTRSLCIRGSLLLRRVGTRLGLALCVLQISKLSRDTARDGSSLARILEAREVGTIAPRERTTEALPGRQRGVVDNVDEALVVGRALAIAREIAEVSAGGEDRIHARNCCDLPRVLRALDSLDHLDQHDVLVDRVAIAAGHAAPHIRIERLSAAVAALAERREVGPVASGLPFLDGVDGWDHDDERAGVERVLDLALISISHTHS